LVSVPASTALHSDQNHEGAGGRHRLQAQNAAGGGPQSGNALRPVYTMTKKNDFVVGLADRMTKMLYDNKIIFFV
jgi:hypothetical protein